ncbi:MAG: hypothetical protein ACK40T_04460 [Akkermansiaceae bacterium]|jgi:hypothetical protein
MKTLFIFFLTIGSILANPFNDISTELSEAEVTIFFESPQKGNNIYDFMFVGCIQGQKLSLECKNYLKWALDIQKPLQLNDKTFQALDKIEIKGAAALIGFIIIEPKDKNYSYFIKKDNHLNIISITKLIPSDENKENPEKELDLGKYYWPQVELVALEIASRGQVEVFGQESYNRARVDFWKQFQNKKPEK